MLGLPETLYHGTSLDRWAKIQNEGLLPPTTIEQMSDLTKAHKYELHAINQSFMTPKLELAEFWGTTAHSMKSPGVVLEINLSDLDISKLHRQIFFNTENGEYAYDTEIPPEKIKIKSIIYPILNSWTMKPKADRIKGIKSPNLRIPISLNTP